MKSVASLCFFLCAIIFPLFYFPFCSIHVQTNTIMILAIAKTNRNRSSNFSHINTHTATQTYTSTDTHTQIHTHTDRHIHTHTHTHTPHTHIHTKNVLSTTAEYIHCKLPYARKRVNAPIEVYTIHTHYHCVIHILHSKSMIPSGSCKTATPL